MTVEFHLHSFVAPAIEPGPTGLSTDCSASRNASGSRLSLTAVRDDAVGTRHG